MENNKNQIKTTEKGELITNIVKMLEVLPESECQRIDDYLSELYFS